MADENIATIWVLPHPDHDKDRVAFWDADPNQPGGELFITGSQTEPVEAKPTSRLNKAIDEKRLVQVDAPKRTSKKQAVPAETTSTDSTTDASGVGAGQVS